MIVLTRFKSAKFVAALIVASAVTVTFAADAQDARGTQQQACSRDVSRNCRKQMNEGDLAIYQCLQQNQAKLSPSCRKVVGGG